MRGARMLAFIVLVSSLFAAAGIGSARAEDKEDCEKKSGDEAIAACTRAIDSKAFRGADLAKLYYLRGSELDIYDKHEAAIKDLQMSIDIDPKSSTFIQLGHSYRTQGDLDRALASYSEAIQLDGNEADGFYYRGNVYRAKGDFDRAIADYNEMAKLDPEDPDAVNSRGIAYAAKGSLDQAIADYTSAIAIDAGFALAFSNRGDAYRRKGDFAKAIADYDEAVRLNPKDAVAFYKRANAYRLRGDYDRALDSYNTLVSLAEKDADPYYERGVTYLLKRDFDRAIADLDRAVTLEPKHASAFHARGLAYAMKKEPQRAIADYSEAIRLEPGNAERYTVRAWQSFRMGRLLLALNDADYAVALDPELMSAYATRAHIYAALGEKDLAEADNRVMADAVAKRQKAEAEAKAAVCAQAETHWKSAEQINTIAVYQDHLAHFATCNFAVLANARIAALSAGGNPERKSPAAKTCAAGFERDSDGDCVRKKPEKKAARRNSGSRAPVERPEGGGNGNALDCTTPAGLIACANRAIGTLPGGRSN